MPVGVLDNDDRVINKDTKDQDEGEKDNDVQRDAKGGKHDKADEHGERYCRRNQQGILEAEEHEQRHDNKEHPRHHAVF